jgi:hypothetical protein
MNSIAIHGLPRSGTSWLGEIFNSCPDLVYKFQPLFSYAFKSYLTPSSTASDIEDFFHLISKREDSFLDQREAREAGKKPRFQKSETPQHVAYKEVRYHQILPNMLRQSPETKLVLITRNPLAVIHSWLNAPREFRRDLGWQVLDEWRYAIKKNLNRPEEYNGFERWKEATSMFVFLAAQYPNQVTLCRYEELASNPLEQTRKLFDFCGLRFTEQTTNFLNQSSGQKDPDGYSVYRSKTDIHRWRDQLDSSIVLAVQTDLADSPLRAFLGIDDVD